MFCPSCPAGYSCNSGSNTLCSATGAKHPFGNTLTSCSVNSAGSFGPYNKLDQLTCPTYTYSSAGATTCNLGSAGFGVTSTDCVNRLHFGDISISWVCRLLFKCTNRILHRSWQHHKLNNNETDPSRILQKHQQPHQMEFSARLVKHAPLQQQQVVMP